MDLKKLKTYIEGDILDLSNQEFNSEKVAAIISLILNNWSEFEATISSIDFSHNKMQELPHGFLELCDLLDRKNLDRLDFYGNPFEELTMEDTIAILQATESTNAVSMHFFQDDEISRERCQRFIHRSMQEYILMLDPRKNRDKQEVALELAQYATKLLADYAEQVNKVYSEEQVMTALVNLSAKDAYEFNPHLLQSQIARVMEQYYNLGPRTSSSKKVRA